MDPVTHTLVGAALGKASFERRTPLALPTLLIGANLPDVDAAAYWWGETFALTFRRGWTHGVLAVVVLPCLLTGGMLLWDRFVRRVRDRSATPASAVQLLALSAVAVLSHPLLDLLNVYGIRLLMPFDDQWFYGDVLFIVDPWVWVVLAGGVIVARRRARPWPARAALLATGLYVAAMIASGKAAAWLAVRSAPFAGAGIVETMAAPVPLTPFRRWIVVDEGDRYRVGELDWLRRPRVRYDELVVLAKGDTHPAVRRLQGIPAAREFLYWARFPLFRVRERTTGADVDIIDARYAVEADAPFGTLSVPIPP